MTSSTILVKGDVVDGASVDVTIGGGTIVAATLEAASAGRRAWTAELTAPAPGGHTITATADAPEGGPSTASVTVKVVDLQAFGSWEGEFTQFDGTPARNRVTGGSLVAMYDVKLFRMYFGTDLVIGTTDNWDLVDDEGFRITGTYHAAGEKNRKGDVMPYPWVDYDAIMANGNIIEGSAKKQD